MKNDALLVNPISMPIWLYDFEKSNAGRIIHGIEEQVRLTIELANENAGELHGGPFAAAIFRISTDALIAVGVNVVESTAQSWAHAEMTAIAHAQNLLSTLDLSEFRLVSSCAPCAMCTGAIPWSGVKEIVYGAPKKIPEGIGFDEGYIGEKWRDEFSRRGVNVIGPVLADEAKKPFDTYLKYNGRIY